MTVSEAILRLDKYTGNEVESELKYLWLQMLEDIVYNEIVQTHLDPIDRPAPVSEGERELIVPDPYSEVYIHYMNMQNDLLLRDTRSYANSAAAFVSAYSAYADYYNRTHLPKSEAEDFGV